MENALNSYLKNIKGFVQDDELEGAFDLLRRIDDDFQIGIENDLIIQRSRYKSNIRDMQRGLLPPDNFQRTEAQIRFALLSIVDGIPRKMELNDMLKGVRGMNFSVPSDGNLEKVLGDKSHIVKIAWLEKALIAAKSVGRIVCPDGGTGTGFLTEGGYVFTNNHVLPTESEASGSVIEFNFEEDASGFERTRYRYHFDTSTFITSKDLDYTRVKVLQNPEAAPLSDWGALRISPDAIPVVGDPVNVIQHPNGDVKQIALTANDVVSVWGPRLFYHTDTEPGSSGSPVFNQNWNVVALHHGGQSIDEGGLTINEHGERASANRGFLFSYILKDIQEKTRNA